MINIDNLISKAKNCKIKNNILFLDFDGVINIPIKNIEILSKEELLNSYKYANKKCIENINILCKMFDFKIVISSSYRYNGLEYCKNYLYNSLLDKSIDIIGMTSTDKIDYRYHEIYDYLSNSEFSGFLIIDDIDMKILDKFSIKTKFENGFDNEKLVEAINKFNKIFK